MYVKALYADCWDGRTCTNLETPNPSWGDIAAAVERLDGKRHTIITIGAGGEAHMAVGGGEHGQYVVYATFDNESFRTLLSATTQSQEIMYLVTGGQLGDYPKNIVVDLASALAAAKTFAELGQIDATLNWRDH